MKKGDKFKSCRFISKPFYSESAGRNIIVYSNKNGVRHSTSFARYIYQTHYNVILSRKETVDHIDGNPNNDSIENLQILSLADNIKKYNSQRGDLKMYFTCPFCLDEFSKTKHEAYNKIKNGHLLFCSMYCYRNSRKPRLV